MAKQQQKHDDDDRRTLEQIGLDRPDGRADQVGAVVEHADADAFRQVLADDAQLVDRAAGDFSRVLAGQHDGGPDDGLTPVDGGGAHARGASDRDLGDITHRHGGAEAGGTQRDAGDVLGGTHARVGTNGEGFPTDGEDATAGVLGVLTDSLKQFGHRQGRLRHLGEVGFDQHLTFVTADDVDICQAGSGPQGRADARVMQQTQLTQACGLIGRRLGAICVLNGIINDLPEAGADRSHDRDDARRQVAGGLADTLGHQLAGTKDIRPIREHEGHLRQSGLGERTELDQSGHAGKFGLQRDGHPGFGLIGSEGGQGRVDLHLRTRDVGHRVDRHARGGPKAEQAEQQGDGQDGSATADGPAGKGGDHLSVRRRSRRPP